MSLLRDLFDRESAFTNRAPRIVSYYTQLISHKEGWLGHCPLCQSIEFSFALDGTRWQCTACHSNGGLVDLVAGVGKLKRDVAWQWVQWLAGRPSPQHSLLARFQRTVPPQLELPVMTAARQRLRTEDKLLYNAWLTFGLDPLLLRLGQAEVCRAGYRSKAVIEPVYNRQGRCVSYVAWPCRDDYLGGYTNLWWPTAELANWLAANRADSCLVLQIHHGHGIARELQQLGQSVVTLPMSMIIEQVAAFGLRRGEVCYLLNDGHHWPLSITQPLLAAGIVIRQLPEWHGGLHGVPNREQLAWLKTCANEVHDDGFTAEPEYQGLPSNAVTYYVEREEARLKLNLPLSSRYSGAATRRQHHAEIEQVLAERHPYLFPAKPAPVATPAPASGRRSIAEAQPPVIPPSVQPTTLAATTSSKATWIVDYLLPVGLSFLISEMSSGLPAMLATLATAVAEGKPALQQYAVAAGPVLYLTSAGSKVYHAGKDATHWLGDRPEQLTVLEWRTRLDRAGLEQLATTLKQQPGCKLVVLDEWDVLRPDLSHVRLHDEQSTLKALSRLAQAQGIALLVGHLLPHAAALGDDWLAGLSFTANHEELDGLLAMRRPASNAGVQADGLLFANQVQGSSEHLLYYASRKTRRWRVRGAAAEG